MTTIDHLDEGAFQERAEALFRAVGDALESVDSDLVDYESAGDVVTLTLRRAQKCVLNTQRSVRQIWLAASAQAWHFSWDPSAQKWLDDRGRGHELRATIARVVRDVSGVDLVWP